MASRKHNLLAARCRTAFTLIEIVAAITVLALIVSTSLVIINNCLEATVDLRMRRAAFDLARDNMEKLLGATALSESIEYGDSNDVEGLTWETRVETFYEPHTVRMWIKAVCLASWYDTKGELQTIEFTQWLTDLSQQDIANILRRQQAQQEALDEQMLEEVQALYKQILDARDTADTQGYDQMVALSRQLIEDYPYTTTANEVRAMLAALPPAQKQVFDIRPYETTPVTATIDTTPPPTDGSTPAPDTIPTTPDTPANEERIGGYTWAELDAIYEKNPDEFWRIIMENLFNKK